MEKRPRAATGRDSEKYILRFIEGLKEKVEASARANGRSINSEINTRLQQTFDGEVGEDGAALRTLALRLAELEHLKAHAELIAEGRLATIYTLAWHFGTLIDGIGIERAEEVIGASGMDFLRETEVEHAEDFQRLFTDPESSDAVIARALAAQERFATTKKALRRTSGRHSVNLPGGVDSEAVAGRTLINVMPDGMPAPTGNALPRKLPVKVRGENVMLGLDNMDKPPEPTDQPVTKSPRKRKYKIRVPGDED